MPRRAAFPVFVVLVAAACRGGPAAPSGATSIPPAMLQAGPHVLTLEAGPPLTTSVSSFLCITSGAGAPTSAGVPIFLAVEGAGWRGSSDEGDLVLRLSHDGEVLSGTGRGRARTPGGVVVELGQGGADAQLAGRIRAGGYAEGSVDGGLAFSVDGGSTSCSPSRFQLSPR